MIKPINTYIIKNHSLSMKAQFQNSDGNNENINVQTENQNSNTQLIIGGLGTLACLGFAAFYLTRDKVDTKDIKKISDTIKQDSAFIKKIQDKLQKEWTLIKDLPNGMYEKSNGKYVRSIRFPQINIEKLDNDARKIEVFDIYGLNKRTITTDKDGNITNYKIFTKSFCNEPIFDFSKTSDGFECKNKAPEAIHSHRDLINCSAMEQLRKDVDEELIKRNNLTEESVNTALQKLNDEIKAYNIAKKANLGSVSFPPKLSLMEKKNYIEIISARLKELKK